MGHIISTSQGVINISKRSGGPQDFFGTEYRAPDYYEIGIFHAEVTRNINKDYIHPDTRPIVEFRVTPAQFVAMLTCGGGHVPCTIQQVGSDYYEYKGDKSGVEKLKDDMDETIETVFTAVMDIDSAIQATKLSAKTKATLLTKLHRLQRFYRDTVPWILKQVDDAAKSCAQDAMREVDCHILMKQQQYGEQVIQKLLGSPNKE